MKFESFIKSRMAALAAMAGAGASAFAADTLPAPAGIGFEEIIVTATKRGAESIEKADISISEC
jgi:hypothetical protein